MTMMPFHKLFPETTMRDGEAMITSLYGLPRRPFAFLESYCIERNCDCRRVMINVVDADTLEHLATINHALDPPPQSFGDDSDEPQAFLDPLNTQSSLAPQLLQLFEWMLRSDPGYQQRLERHYAKWKAVIDDARHPAQRELRAFRDGLGMPEQRPLHREEPKIGRNAPCPCGSGRKYKKCCGQPHPPAEA